MAALKRLPVHRYILIIFCAFWSCGTVGFNTFIWQQSCAQPEARRREGCHISHEQTQSIRVWCFQTLDSVFPKDIFSDYLEITTAVGLPCGDRKKCCYFYVFWSFGIVKFNTFIWEQSCAQLVAWWCEGCRICHYLS